MSSVLPNNVQRFEDGRCLAPPLTEPPPSWRWQKRGLMTIAFGFLLMFVSAALFDQHGSGPLVYGVAGTSLAAFLAGFALIALGPRADRQNR